MAIVIGLVVALILLLAFNLLGAGMRNPRWLFVGAVLIFALYKFGADQLAEDSQNVLVVAQYSDQCPDRHVRVTIHNGGETAITNMRFSVTGYQPNHSEPVAKRYETTDRIIGADQVWSDCWRVLQLDNVDASLHPSLRWEAEIRGITLAE
ncbi:hypothetical protein [Shimia ponticola]|uniref:hypothetical protein n=1 Tax=Shimia ponticola TaxID=2582893 RepID=UPI0011BD6D3E|nr:hypothetical protein [Shimia ponticola]